MRYFSMFSGIGGFEKGIEDATNQQDSGFRRETRTDGESGLWDRRNITESTSTSWSQKRWECVGFSEIDRYASAIYRYHYPNYTNYGDCRTIDPIRLPDFDLIVGGFPCQSFSIAGKRGGFEDTRGTLFFEIARIARVKRPGYLWLENVKGLLSHDEGNTFATIISTLDELGYDCQWQVLNSKNHGVPQNRERVFIIGNLRGIRRPQVFPLREDVRAYSESYPDAVVNCIDSNYGKGWLDHGQRTMVIQKTSGQTITTHWDETGCLQSGGANVRNKTPNIVIPMMIARGPDDSLYVKDNVPALGQGSQRSMNRQQSIVMNGMSIRRLTPIECERLQGFPDNWTKYGLFDNGAKEISDTQRYKCCGNAVTTNVIRDIALAWMERL